MNIQTYLLLDEEIVARTHGVHLAVQQATRFAANPILRIDQPWEKDALIGYATVIYDDADRLFKAWYPVGYYNVTEPRQVGGALAYVTHVGRALAYATSEDGLHWKKPTLGLVEQDGTRDNNLLFPMLRSFHFKVLKDPSEAIPDRMYKMLFYFRTEETIWAGMFTPINVAYSSDGIHWHMPRWTNPVIAAGTDALGTYWNAERRRYVALLRPERNTPRTVCMSESDDFVHWTPRVPIVVPDEHDPPHSREFYGMVVTRYDAYYLGFLEVYHTLHEAWTAYHELTPDLPEGIETIDVQLVHSRDGRVWQRTADRAPLLSVGAPGSWDAGLVHPAQSPLLVGDELWVYYSGSGRHHYDEYRPGYRLEPHRSGLGLATLPRDRLVAAEAESEGILETKFLRTIPEQIRINAAASGGSVRVELLTPFGQVIPGLSREACDPFRGDERDHHLTWQGQPQISAVAGALRGGVCLRFYLERAKLFGFSLATSQ